ncbi:hypothetical protein TCDM_09528 [Trypanosoma cruzi Dm28c]|uniref:Uncharacterized protein n=1 Tax=Trypanosoma cruzi Dm28c TaxID=1416333 RepID=V5BEC7_TRYCR|nr:hypothetical protein TCDM_09528 [Trypanosoma cruzi Dm28c]
MRTENTATVTAGEGHRAAASARNASPRPSLPKTFLQSTVQLLICVWVSVGEAEKRSTGRHITTARGTAGWQRYMRHGTTSTITHDGSTYPSKKENTAAACVALRVSARPDRKETKQEGRNVCSAPQALVARPHVTAPSARRSSRPLLMRAAGEAHSTVVVSVSVGVRVEQLGGNTRHPSQEECSNKQLKMEE